MYEPSAALDTLTRLFVASNHNNELILPVMITLFVASGLLFLFSLLNFMRAVQKNLGLIRRNLSLNKKLADFIDC